MTTFFFVLFPVWFVFQNRSEKRRWELRPLSGFKQGRDFVLKARNFKNNIDINNDNIDNNDNSDNIYYFSCMASQIEGLGVVSITL